MACDYWWNLIKVVTDLRHHISADRLTQLHIKRSWGQSWVATCRHSVIGRTKNQSFHWMVRWVMQFIFPSVVQLNSCSSDSYYRLLPVWHFRVRGLMRLVLISPLTTVSNVTTSPEKSNLGKRLVFAIAITSALRISYVRRLLYEKHRRTLSGACPFGSSRLFVHKPRNRCTSFHLHRWKCFPGYV